MWARAQHSIIQIEQPLQLGQHQGGPAILFRHKASNLRLDSYLDVHGERLNTETRVDMVRQLAEAVQYAHHYALTLSSSELNEVERTSAPRAGDVELDLP